MAAMFLIRKDSYENTTGNPGMECYSSRELVDYLYMGFKELYGIACK